MVNAADHLAELASQILTRWDMEPVDAIFPCSAVREDLRTALEQHRKAVAVAIEAIANAKAILLDEEYTEAAAWCDDALRALGG